MNIWKSYIWTADKDYCLSSVHNCEDRFHIHVFIRSSKLPVGLLAQLVEHCTGIAEVMGSNPVQAWIFFRPYFHYCFSSVHNCENRFHIQVFILRHLQEKCSIINNTDPREMFFVFSRAWDKGKIVSWLSGNASERRIRTSEVRILLGTQNFFYASRSWQDEKHISLSLTELKTYHLSYSIYKYWSVCTWLMG